MIIDGTSNSFRTSRITSNINKNQWINGLFWYLLPLFFSFELFDARRTCSKRNIMMVIIWNMCIYKSTNLDKESSEIYLAPKEFATSGSTWTTHHKSPLGNCSLKWRYFWNFLHCSWSWVHWMLWSGNWCLPARLYQLDTVPRADL